MKAGVRDAYASFQAAQDPLSALVAFEDLLHHLDAEQPVTIDRLSTAAEHSSLSFKQKRLFAVLKNTGEASQPPGSDEYAMKRVVVSGAGPCGCRAAVAARLMGYQVTLVEKRAQFQRHNIIKTWLPTIQDLVSFGLLQFLPTFKPHGHLHLGIRQCQMVLFKAALCLGVDVLIERCSVGVYQDAEEWSLVTLPTQIAKMQWSKERRDEEEEEKKDDHLSLMPTSMDAEACERLSKVDFFEVAESRDGAVLSSVPEGASLTRMDALLIAEGESSWMIRNLGFHRKLVRYAQAIGVVVNLARLDGSRGNSEGFVVSRAQAQWKSTCLGELDADHGIQLENMEYMQGIDTHFLVATVPRRCLLEQRVLRCPCDTTKELLASDNVDLERLRWFGRVLADAARVPPECPFSQFHPVQIFDFSAKGKCQSVWRLLGDDDDDDDGDGVPVMPVGDTLQNPYWPQGLGVNRGFHSALDAVWAIAHGPEERTCASRVMDWSFFSRASLQPACNWTVDPTTRYSERLYRSMYLHELKKEEDLLTDRIRQAFNMKKNAK